ncbi:MAG: hypothetical protein SGILL_005636 [Bacillariaceae sp.]
MTVAYTYTTTKYNNPFPTPPKKANMECSNMVCSNLAIDEDGKRIEQPHKSRACAVCGIWYCGYCKKQFLKKSIHKYETGPQALEEEVVYKCKCCKGQKRQYHQS